MKWLRIGEEKNYPWCLVNLGWAYRNGNGVEKNWVTAAEYYNRSIAARSTKGYSEDSLGDLYFTGDNDIERDYEKAAIYYEAALAKGTKSKNLAEAEYRTGKKYYYEQLWLFYAPEDYAQAVEWFKKAHKHGYDDDDKCICIYWIGNGYRLLENYDEALKWLILGEEKGNRLYALNLGQIFRLGHGIEKNFAETIWHYERAIELGSKDGYIEYYVAMIYLAGGHGLKRNVNEADK